MRQRFILFSAPMVCAILDGRKSVTRRVIMKPPTLVEPGDDALLPPGWWWKHGNHVFRLPDAARECCPYGQKGDRLWVKEACWLWCARRVDGTTPTGKPKCFYDPVGQHVVYCADGEKPTHRLDDDPTHNWRYKTARFMPAWASRLTLQIDGVRAERLQEITEADVMAEGFAKITKDNGRMWKFGLPDRDGLPGTDDYGWPWSEWDKDYRAAWGKGWDRINGERGVGWAFNPWVWSITFHVVERKDKAHGPLQGQGRTALQVGQQPMA